MFTSATVSTVNVPESSYGQILATKAETSVVREVAPAKYTELAVREYFADIPIMIEVARCESQFRHTLSDGSILRGRVDGRDTGVMQINTHYHQKTANYLELNLENLNDNMAYARNLYERSGTQPWSASMPCWGNSLAMR